MWRATVKAELENTQGRVDALADLVWLRLSEIFQPGSRRRRPKLYLYLSKESEGSLAKRSSEERDFVLLQQQFDGGATLKQPPIAYVANWRQVPEECSHLFALSHGVQKEPEQMDEELSLMSSSLHEAFGRFGHCLLLGFTEKTKPSRKKLSDILSLWEISHQEGYYLGEALAKAYYSEKLKDSELKDFFCRNWYKKPSARAALKWLYSLSKRAKPHPDFGLH